MLMRNIQSTASDADQGVATLKTTFASRQQGASLIRALDLTPEEMEQVSGGVSDFATLVIKCICFPDPISCMPRIDREIPRIDRSLDLGAI
jgi:hypothetical protein